MTDAYFKTLQVSSGDTYIDNESVANGAAPGGTALRQRITAFSGGPFPVRQWGNFYNVRGQRYIASTGYVTQDLNAVAQPIGAFVNPSGSNTVIIFDKAEFGATQNCRFSRFGGASSGLTLNGAQTAKPIGRTDGGSSSGAVALLYSGGNSGVTQITSVTGGTLRKVAVMQAYAQYQLNDIGGTIVLQPGQMAYWTMDEQPGGGAGTFYTLIDFEWVEMPLTTWNSMVTALQAKAEW